MSKDRKNGKGLGRLEEKVGALEVKVPIFNLQRTLELQKDIKQVLTEI